MLASRRCFLLAKEGGRIVQLPIEAGSDGIFVKVDLAKGEGNLKKSVEFDYARIGETSSSLSSPSHQICLIESCEIRDSSI